VITSERNNFLYRHHNYLYELRKPRLVEKYSENVRVHQNEMFSGGLKGRLCLLVHIFNCSTHQEHSILSKQSVVLFS